MKIGSDCSGECILCANSGFCLAGHGDDDFFPATKEQLISRVKNAECDWEKTKIIIATLWNVHRYNMEIDETEWGKERERYLKEKRQKIENKFSGHDIDEAIGFLEV